MTRLPDPRSLRPEPPAAPAIPVGGPAFGPDTTPRHPDLLAGNTAPLVWTARVPMLAGLAALLVLVGVLGAWGMGARIAGAVIATGTVQVQSNRQVVQHVDGGVVGAILVREGDRVEAGQVLVQLDGSRAQAERDIVEGQLREIAVRQARLRAERDGAEAVTFEPALMAQAGRDAQLAANIAEERALFQARHETLQQETSLLAEQNTQIDNRIAGIEAQLDALREQSALVAAELVNQEQLLERQLTQAARANDLRRDRANLRGQTGRLEAEIAELRGQAAGNDIARLQLVTRRREQAVGELRDLQFRDIELTQRQRILAETLSRLDIRAPMAGIVHESRIYALQSVIRGAEPLMYIVPQDQPLVVSARIEAQAIDDVRHGQEAALLFSAFDQRHMPEILGDVTRVSADAVMDERTGMNFYTIEITPRPGHMELLAGETLLPGMPVEAFLRTTERSPIDYLTEPLTAYFNRAFRE